ncbi:hypothetical protein JNJ66_03075 [Candidatus Saccharibacteria bacterium]|nr:hypothetical protein [Candidatus Saccharibacteria bacterium]
MPGQVVTTVLVTVVSLLPFVAIAMLVVVRQARRRMWAELDRDKAQHQQDCERLLKAQECQRRATGAVLDRAKSAEEYAAALVSGLLRDGIDDPYELAQLNEFWTALTEWAFWQGRMRLLSDFNAQRTAMLEAMQLAERNGESRVIRTIDGEKLRAYADEQCGWGPVIQAARRDVRVLEDLMAQQLAGCEHTLLRLKRAAAAVSQWLPDEIRQGAARP